jgi:hypothetical protein
MSLKRRVFLASRVTKCTKWKPYRDARARAHARTRNTVNFENIRLAPDGGRAGPRTGTGAVVRG